MVFDFGCLFFSSKTTECVLLHQTPSNNSVCIVVSIFALVVHYDALVSHDQIDRENIFELLPYVNWLKG